MTRPQKITLGEMRAMGIRGLLIYCSDYKCSHNVEISAKENLLGVAFGYIDGPQL
jgi:hypothetical protein